MIRVAFNLIVVLQPRLSWRTMPKPTSKSAGTLSGALVKATMIESNSKACQKSVRIKRSERQSGRDLINRGEDPAAANRVTAAQDLVIGVPEWLRPHQAPATTAFEKNQAEIHDKEKHALPDDPATTRNELITIGAHPRRQRAKAV